AGEIPLFFTLIPVLALLSNYDQENCLINVGTEGFFTVGYLLIAIFDMLGRPRMGWVYFLTFGSIVLLTFESGVPVLFVWPVVYVVGWLHANVILSRIESLARHRVAEIDQQAADPYALVEKAMLQVKVLRQREQAICTAEKALLMRGDDPMLLYTMGVALFAKRYAEAKPLLDRAGAEVKDETAAN
ncbi:MAG: hypothetical protein WBQ65_06695, partial [Bryobacteraceae bacterium]